MIQYLCSVGFQVIEQSKKFGLNKLSSVKSSCIFLYDRSHKIDGFDVVAII